MLTLQINLPQPSVSTVSKASKLFLVDSGASHHCVREKSLFTSFRPGKHIVRIADNKIVSAVGKGTVLVNVESTVGKSVSLQLTEVYLVPSFQHNIFSVEHFLAASVHNSVSLSSAERLLCTLDCNISLLGEHKLIWLPVYRSKSTPVPLPSSSREAEVAPSHIMIWLLRQLCQLERLQLLLLCCQLRKQQ